MNEPRQHAAPIIITNKMPRAETRRERERSTLFYLLPNVPSKPEYSLPLQVRTVVIPGGGVAKGLPGGFLVCW